MRAQLFLRFASLLCLPLFAQSAFGQLSDTGLDQFGTFQRNHVQTMNLFNLNNHIEFPLFAKKERGVNFNAKLVWDLSDSLTMIQVPYPPGGQYFQVSCCPGPITVTDVYYNSHLVGGQTCSPFQGAVSTYFDSVVDQNSTTHRFWSGSYVKTGQGCGSGTWTTSTVDGQWLLTVTWTDQNCGGQGCITSVTETDSSGNVYGGPSGSTTALTDPNGNQITKSTPTPGNSTWTDPTGNTIFTAQQPSPPPHTFSYPIQTGGMANVQLNFTSGFTLQNTFGCSQPYTKTSATLATSIALPDGSSYAFAYESSNGTYPSSTVTGRIHSITLPAGGTYTYTYSGGTNGINCLDGKPAILTITGSDGSVWTYNRTVSSCISNCTTPQVITVVTDPACNDTVYGFEITGLQLQVQSYQGTAGTAACSPTTKTLLQTVTSCYNGNFTNCAITSGSGSCPGSQLVCRADKYAYLPGLSQPSLSETFYNSAGLVTQQNEFDFGVNTGAAPTTAPLRATKTTYASIGNNILNRPSCVQVTGGTSPATCGTVTSTTNAIAKYLNYDSHGNVGQIQNWVSGSTYLSRNFTYYSTGLVHTATDFKSNQTTYTYGNCNNSYVSNVVEPLNLSRSTAWDCNGGVVTSTTDENGKQTQYSYTNPVSGVADPFWRMTRVTFPDGGQTTTTYNDTATPVNVTTSQLIDNAGNSLATQTNFDGLGRPVLKLLTSDPAGTVYTQTSYDAVGRVGSAYNPTRCNPPTTNCGESTWGFTSYTYDALGRTTQVTQPDGSIATSFYSGNTTTVTDEAGKKRQSTTDGLGRLTQVTEDPGASPHLNYVTNYTYDALNNLTSVLQNGSRQRTFVYNSLSQLTSATNPESGTATYTYDNNGNLASKTSPAPNQTGTSTVTLSYCYDALNRMTSKAYTSQSCPMSAPVATYIYDAASLDGHTLTNPVGRLVKAATMDGQTATWNSYDQMGRIINQWQCSPLNCGATPYTKTFANDLLGNHTSETYSYTTGTLTISYAYDAAARATQVTSSYVDAQHPATLISGITYTPPGGISQLTYGNGLVETRSYNNRLQPTQMRTYNPSNGADILNMSYGFNAGTANNGNVASWSATGQQTFNRTYLYDPLNRIASMSSPSDPTGCTGLSWTIDPWGNRTDQNLTSGTCGQFHATVNTKNQLVDPINNSYLYDAAGNMTYDGSHHYTYDAENHVTQVDSGSTASYIYDTDGRRARKTVGTSTTDYLYDLSGNIFSTFGPGCTSGCWTAGAVYLNGRFVAEYYNSTTYFVHPDHLGSTRILTAMDKSIFDNMDYLPFGEQIAGGTGSTLKFTGKERDSESGLDDFEARYLGSSTGRFMSVDPDNLSGLLNQTDPQAWNGYAYVRNSPLIYTDPGGTNYQVCDPDGKNCADLTNEQYAQWRKDSPDVSMRPSGDLYVGNTKVGSATYYNQKDIQAAQFLSGPVQNLVTTAGYVVGGAMAAVYAGAAYGTYQVGTTALNLAGAGGAAAPILYKTGEIVEEVIQTPAGPVKIVGEVVVQGTQITIKNISVFSAETGARINAGLGPMLRGIRPLLGELKDAGYTTVRFVAERYSGANPGPRDFTIHLR